jgi:hypothetical protein
VSGFRGDDTTLEREIEAVRATSRLRVRRIIRELDELDRELKGLLREKARRRASAREMVGEPTAEEAKA